MNNYKFKKGDIVICTVSKVIYTVDCVIPTMNCIAIQSESNIVGLISGDNIKLYKEYHRKEMLKLLLDEL